MFIAKDQWTARRTTCCLFAYIASYLARNSHGSVLDISSRVAHSQINVLCPGPFASVLRVT